ncbi:MAG TPA: LuxR C-terminal-related transcriptional regulator [Bacteroidia bacterium]|jgi:DNA-binding CsgD family transcriptional regulator|nr:LuxR C-terminal-related transcriptional regulator [Bacteroidia bacterium]
MPKKLTYKNYLQKLHGAVNEVDKSHVEKIILQFQQLSKLSILLPHSPAIFVIDYSKRQYIFFSNSVGDYQADEIIKGGLDFMMPLMQKNFFNTYNEQVFPSILSFLKKIPTEQHPNYIISCNHRIKNADEKNIDVFQRSTYITSNKTGLPTHCIGMAINISHFKNDDSIALFFEQKDTQNGMIHLLEKKVFFPYQDEGLLDEQEKTILRYIYEGLSSKQIGKKLHLSFRTVQNKRLKMHAKTKIKSVAKLIDFALENKII